MKWSFLGGALCVDRSVIPNDDRHVPTDGAASQQSVSAPNLHRVRAVAMGLDCKVLNLEAEATHACGPFQEAKRYTNLGENNAQTPDSQ